ncbi:hypothetical protein SAMN02910291_01885 [Desulfovibrio desulfuricans]|uniref:Uncharacterized protein n=1 Tax=Desulfovibrio desulfuricans TaxID=876 RepID=A0AA94HTK8_DESDE|nr:hypothetical protein SAMN02910291_01885 [Desulfovibrio desulfuricans]SPD36789.1 Hypothetical protein DSVG11_2755 [Desulfovibrio sp. G11]
MRFKGNSIPCIQVTANKAKSKFLFCPQHVRTLSAEYNFPIGLDHSAKCG